MAQNSKEKTSLKTAFEAAAYTTGVFTCENPKAAAEGVACVYDQAKMYIKYAGMKLSGAV
jgi:hypothetical protein